MDSAGRRIILWTGATSGLSSIALEQLLLSAAHNHGVYSSLRDHAPPQHQHQHQQQQQHRLSVGSPSTGGSLAAYMRDSSPGVGGAPSDRRRSSGDYARSISRERSGERRGSVSSTHSTSGQILSPIAETPRLHLILALRDRESENTVEVLEHFENLAAMSDSVIDSYECDLSSFKSVREFASTVTTTYEAISTIVLGAEITCFGPPSYTEFDRTEMGLTVNHLAQWLLVAQLAAVVRYRVVFVGNSAFRNADLTNMIPIARRKGPVLAGECIPYPTTKAIQALCFDGWVKYFRHKTGKSSASVDVLLCTPGSIAPEHAQRRRASSFVSSIAGKVGIKNTPESSADVIAHVAISSSFEGMSGSCINKHMKPEKLNFSNLHADPADVMKIETQVQKLLHPSSQADPRLPLPSHHHRHDDVDDLVLNGGAGAGAGVSPVPMLLSDTIQFWKQVEQSTPESRERDRVAYWNWTCIVTKQFELMVDPERVL